MSVDITGIESADPLILLALAEDLGDRGDLTSRATIPHDAKGEVRVVARENGRLAGAVLIERVYSALAAFAPDLAGVTVTQHLADGATLEPGSHIASVSGPVRALLGGERIVLNFLIHLSGIASRTAEFVEKVEGSGAVILDTRKTLPGYRLLHKYAVRCGGGCNHRMGLYDGILIKDNHLASRESQSVAESIHAARAFLEGHGYDVPIEVEVDTLEQLRDVLSSQPAIVLLDNMRTSHLQQAVSIRNELSPDTLLEASGGVNLETVGCIAGSGIDRISIGGLTHSAPALDIGYDWKT